MVLIMNLGLTICVTIWLFTLIQMVQRELNYAIVDEVDSILIDEARTPLIISGPGDKSELYGVVAKAIIQLKEGEDYTVDEKAKAVLPTEFGIAKIEKALNVTNLYDQKI